VSEATKNDGENVAASRSVGFAELRAVIARVRSSRGAADARALFTPELADLETLVHNHGVVLDEYAQMHADALLLAERVEDVKPGELIPPLVRWLVERQAKSDEDLAKSFYARAARATAGTIPSAEDDRACGDKSAERARVYRAFLASFTKSTPQATEQSDVPASSPSPQSLEVS
jgi:hypothetical protein